MSTEVEEERDVWAFLELSNVHAPEAQDLYSWGLNFNHQDNPFRLFLDLVGFSQDNYGEAITGIPASLGYMEMGKLADALNEYADNPHGVDAWLVELMACDNA